MKQKALSTTPTNGWSEQSAGAIVTKQDCFVDVNFLASSQSENTKLREETAPLAQVEGDRLSFEKLSHEAWEKLSELKQRNEELQERVYLIEQQLARLAPLVAVLDAAQVLTPITVDFRTLTKLPGHLLWKDPVEREEYLQKYHTQAERMAWESYVAKRPDLIRETVVAAYKKIPTTFNVAHDKHMKYDTSECRRVLMASIDREDRNEVDGVDGLVRLLEAVNSLVD